MSNPTPERNVVREAQTVENYDPLAKQKVSSHSRFLYWLDRAAEFI